MSLGCSRNLANFFARNDHTIDEYELIKGAITQDDVGKEEERATMSDIVGYYDQGIFEK